ncbi:hypothetical protein BJ085DRAFT_29242 [Dimargaris cristalligena]|uniref:Uncharacterized protein n=1 Tax=Dimargaris cristalligena TaxID=215637 RepID=A0A4P9ZXL0_9FUNG|nr:hypothetical protein BJ085DRAFT_29242 [Dimargaris cristalligena]|eukprot:RKP38445.1 hypothetical protein BJ085DRAFT_29242 [Dimargaris cristalligena]
MLSLLEVQLPIHSLSLLITKVTTAPGLSMGFPSHDDFGAQPNPTDEKLDNWAKLPFEQKEAVFGYLSPLSRHHLSYTSRGNHALVAKLLSDLVQLTMLVAPCLVNQPRAVKLFIDASRTLSSAAGRIEGDRSDPNPHTGRNVLSNFYQYLLANQADPLFQSTAVTWRYTNPHLLPQSVFVARLPLLDLVDLQRNGEELTEVLSILGNPLLKTLSYSGDPVDFMVGLKQWLNNKYVAESVARVNAEYESKPQDSIMAQNMVDDTVLNEAIVKAVTIAEQIALKKYHEFNRFAIILAAVAQQTEPLAHFTAMYTDPSSNIATKDMKKAKWELVQLMKMATLPKGAAFLDSYWRLSRSWESNQAAGPGFGDGGTVGRPIMEGEAQVHYSPTDFSDLNDLPDMPHISLIDENQMALLAFAPEFNSEELIQASDVRFE